MAARLTALLLLVVFTGPAAEATAVDDVCNSLQGGLNVTPELCTSVLCAGPCRAAGDPAAVAALAARLASQNATATKGRMETALSSRPVNDTPAGAVVTNAVRSCLNLYAAAVPALQWAAEAAAAGQYRGAREVMKAAEYVAEGCQGLGAGAALPGDNSAFVSVARVGQAVLASMIKG